MSWSKYSLCIIAGVGLQAPGSPLDSRAPPGYSAVHIRKRGRSFTPYFGSLVRLVEFASIISWSGTIWLKQSDDAWQDRSHVPRRPRDVISRREEPSRRRRRRILDGKATLSSRGRALLRRSSLPRVLASASEKRPRRGEVEKGRRERGTSSSGRGIPPLPGSRLCVCCLSSSS